MKNHGLMLFSLLVALALVPAGCGDGGGNGHEDADIDLIGDDMRDTDVEAETPVDPPVDEAPAEGDVPTDDAAEGADDVPVEDVIPDGVDGDPVEEDAVEEDTVAEDAIEEDVVEEDAPPTCGNGTVDPGEDCDGAAPRDCTTTCSSTGTQSCVACAWAACVPPAETCNGLDDDCVGGADNGLPCVMGATVNCTTTCSTTGTGTCTATCQVPAPADCTPPAEICNGLDDDCVGGADNGLPCVQGTTGACTTPEGFSGTHTCSSTCTWGDCIITCPAECSTVPTGGSPGSACTSDAQCTGTGADCWTETTERFRGEDYTDNPGGMCVPWGSGTSVCDPDNASSCPSGSSCEYMGSSMGTDFYGCMDACLPLDSSGREYPFNCGCREGYACDIVSGICTSGCTNDRECCERWWDEDGDFNRDAAEVVEKTGCTNVCDDTPAGICQATHDCVNNGDATNVWSGPCEGDAWCPADGRCLDEFNYAPNFPGGLCIKDRCDVAGRGCTTEGGGCMNLGTTTDPFWACVGRCHFGRQITDPTYECRDTTGEEQACNPVLSSAWYTPPTDGSNGFCWPGNFPGGAMAIGGTCTTDTNCTSPYGLGYCASFTGITAPSFCSAGCVQFAAEDFAVCGGNDGTGRASGVCWSDICWEGCGTPGGNLGANGCLQATMACYPVTMFSDVYKDNASLMPQGMCIPRCTDGAWCQDFWGLPLACNTTSGVCS